MRARLERERLRPELLERLLVGAGVKRRFDVAQDRAVERIDRGFNRPFSEQVRAESVDGADVRFLEVLDRGIEPLLHLGR